MHIPILILTLQAGYAVDNLRGETKLKAASVLAGFFKIPGEKDQESVRQDIKWLLEQSNFMYGDLDTEVRCLRVLLHLLQSGFRRAPTTFKSPSTWKAWRLSSLSSGLVEDRLT